MRVEKLTPPAVEPVSLAEAKLHLRVTIDNDDDLINGFISSAREVCETRLKQALITQTLKVYYDGFPFGGGYYNREIRQIFNGLGGFPGGSGPYPGVLPTGGGVLQIPHAPLQSVTAVQYYDMANHLLTVDPSSYVVSRKFQGRVQPVYGMIWPLTRPGIDAVQITYVAGYGDAATDVPSAIRSAVKLMVGGWYENRESVSAGNPGMVPFGVEALLASAKHGGYG